MGPAAAPHSVPTGELGYAEALVMSSDYSHEL